MPESILQGWKAIQNHLKLNGIDLTIRALQYWHKRTPLPFLPMNRRKWIVIADLDKFIRDRNPNYLRRR